MKSTSEYTAEARRLRKKYRSTTHYVLSSLVPYTESNLKLAFHPHSFFNDLEKLGSTDWSSGTLRSSYYRAVKQGLVEVEKGSIPRLTAKGQMLLKRYEPRKLKGEASVLVIFDIPEEQRRLRDRMRMLLRELKFTQVQQSVWQSEYDVVGYLVPDLEKYDLSGYVQVHESVRIN